MSKSRGKIMATKTETYDVILKVTITGEEGNHQAALNSASLAVHNRFQPVNLKVNDCECKFKVDYI